MQEGVRHASCSEIPYISTSRIFYTAVSGMAIRFTHPDWHCNFVGIKMGARWNKTT